MSSHHIVREKQEPALLVLQMDHFEHEYLGQLLEWSPTVIATADTLDVLMSEGIKVDWLLGAGQHPDLQNDIKIIPCNSNHVLHCALTELAKQGYSAVNIVTGNAADTDTAAKFINQMNVVLYTPAAKIFAIRTGYRKWLPAGEMISIKSAAQNLETDGLEKMGDTAFRTIADGIITINFTGHYLFIAEAF